MARAARTGEAMLRFVLSMPEQLMQGAALASRARLGRRGTFDRVVIAGMGGSGIGGDVLPTLMAECSPVLAASLRGHMLPATAPEYSLLVSIRHSGGTAEVSSACLVDCRRESPRIVLVNSEFSKAGDDRSSVLPSPTCRIFSRWHANGSEWPSAFEDPRQLLPALECAEETRMRRN
jgi:fructoselysine-6-P-deglycase FrlB-like protein